MEQKVNLTLSGNENTLIVRTGAALPEQAPLQINISGTISAPADWLEDHKLFNKEDSFVSVSLDKRQIVYRSNPGFYLNTSVTGALKMSKQLSRLKLNDGQTYNAQNLAKHLKTVISLATSRADMLTAIGRLETLKMKVNKEVEKAKDDKGNVKLDFNQIVDSNLVFELSFRVPYFEKEEAVEVKAMIVIEDVTQHDVSLTLQNYELPDLMDANALLHLNREVERFEKSDAKTTIIWEN